MMCVGVCACVNDKLKDYAAGKFLSPWILYSSFSGMRIFGTNKSPSFFFNFFFLMPLHNSICYSKPFPVLKFHIKALWLVCTAQYSTF